MTTVDGLFMSLRLDRQYNSWAKMWRALARRQAGIIEQGIPVEKDIFVGCIIIVSSLFTRFQICNIWLQRRNNCDADVRDGQLENSLHHVVERQPHRQAWAGLGLFEEKIFQVSALI